MKKDIISVRIEPALRERLDKVCDQERDPYAPSKAKIVERGIELALRELEAKRGKK